MLGEEAVGELRPRPAGFADAAGGRRFDRLTTGWHVLRVWEHELARRGETKLVGRLLRAMLGKDGVTG